MDMRNLGALRFCNNLWGIYSISHWDSANAKKQLTKSG